MISALLLSSFLGAMPDVSAAITEARRTFLEDGDERVSATPTHRVISHADGSLELQGAQPLRLSLQSVRREGAQPCRAEARARTVDGRTLHTTRACALEETWTNGPAGLAHSFTLQRPPRGTGALTLFLSVEGPWHHQDRGGHVFRGPGGAAALRYGNAFVVRSGRKLPVTVTRVEGGLELKVPQALVDAPGAFPMFIDPTLSSEVALDPNANELGTPPTDEQSPAIATNTLGQALVVWVDNRRQSGTDVFGARLNLSGDLVDQTGLPIALEPGHQQAPTVCGEGSGWLVAYASELVNGGSEIRVVRVNNLGQVGTPFVVEGGSEPALAAKGTNAQTNLAFVDPTGVLRVVTITGTTITPEGASTAAMGVASHPAIAATETRWFVAWVSTLGTNPPVIRGLTTEQGLLTPVQLSGAANVLPAGRPTVAMAPGLLGDQAFIYWEQGGSVVGKRYGAMALDTILNASSPSLVMTSAVAGAQPTLGYFQNTSLKLVDLNDGGFTTNTVSVRARELALAASGRLYAVWTENTLGGTADVWALTLAPGNVTTAFTLAQAAPAQRLPHVAFPEGQVDGLAVWVEGDKVIRGARARLLSDGTLSMGSSFLIADPLGSVLAIDLAASGTGNDFLVTWLMAGGVVHGHLSTPDGPGGAVAIPFNIGGAVTPPAIAWDDQFGLWVVAWGTATEVVSRTLVPGNAPSALRIHSTVTAGQLDLGCLKGKCLVAWDFDGGVQAAVYGAVTLGIPGVSLVNGAQPVVTHDGTRFVLGWRSPSGLGFARVDPATNALTLLDSVTSSTVSRFSNLSLAPGTPPVLAWMQNDTDGGATVFVDRLGLVGQRASLAPGQLPVVGTAGTLGAARGAVVYQRYDPEPTLQSMRSWGRGFAFPAPPDAGVDAGTDAGVPDGGVDAGLEDAGTSDAGEPPDAGVMIFRTTGCTCQSLDAAPLVLALFALLLRRR